MKNRTLGLGFAVCSLLGGWTLPAQTALTIYNQNFAVVRETVPLDLAKGVNSASFDRATLHVEPDSVVLRDPSGKIDLRILEQSYRADVASPALLLALFEGKELDFLVRGEGGTERTVRGKVIRADRTSPGDFQLFQQRFGSAFAQRHHALANSGGNGPIIEIDGKLRFSLPGEPLFPALANNTVLRPTLSWQLSSNHAAKLDAELGYITGGLTWTAAYNLVAPEKGDTLDLVGWVTLENQSGQTFTDTKVKLMAGDVSKLEPETSMKADRRRSAVVGLVADGYAPEPVTEKTFDEFHLYSLPRLLTLRNRETKQVEFLRAAAVPAKTIYIYNGTALDANRYQHWNDENIRNERDYGTRSNPKIWVYREFKNTKENGLGVPLPAGRTRFYRRDDADGAIEFTGENMIAHTPDGETVRIYTGDAFDLVGERKRTDYRLHNANDQLEEAFEIKLRNRKKEPAEVRVTERLYRWLNWSLLENSEPYVKTDARNIEFRVNLAPGEEKTLTYRVRYDWK